MIVRWTFDPVALQLGPVAIRWYGMLFVGGFLLGDALLQRIFAAEGRAPKQAERLLMAALIGSVVGARLVHCAFYEPAYFLAHPLDVFKVWQGGLASHGGALGLIAALAVTARRLSPPVPLLWLLDRVAIPTAFAGAMIRIANYLNSEIVGLPTHAQWGVIFTAVDALPRHPVQLYEAASYAAIGLLLCTVYRRAGRRPPPGKLLGLFLLAVFGARIVLEAFKTPQAAYEGGQALTVGQWLSVPFLMLGVFFLVRAYRSKQVTPPTA